MKSTPAPVLRATPLVHLSLTRNAGVTLEKDAAAISKLILGDSARVAGRRVGLASERSSGTGEELVELPWPALSMLLRRQLLRTDHNPPPTSLRTARHAIRKAKRLLPLVAIKRAKAKYYAVTRMPRHGAPLDAEALAAPADPPRPDRPRSGSSRTAHNVTVGVVVRHDVGSCRARAGGSPFSRKRVRKKRVVVRVFYRT